MRPVSISTSLGGGGGSKHCHNAACFQTVTAVLLVSCLLTDGRCGWEVRKGEVGGGGGGGGRGGGYATSDDFYLPVT